MMKKNSTQRKGGSPRGGGESVRPGLPLKFTPPRVTTYRAEDLEKKDLIINAGTDDPFESSEFGSI